MLSIISHPHTTLLRTLWTSARILRLAAHGLNLTSGTAYSALSSCGLLAVRPSSLALHFFPHTRPPDIAARLEYQGTLTLLLIYAASYVIAPNVLLPSPEVSLASICLTIVTP